MKIAGKLIIVSFILDCGCAYLALGARQFVPSMLPAILVCSALLCVIGAVTLEIGRRSLARTIYPATGIDLRLAGAVISAVPPRTEASVLQAIDTLNLIRTRSVLDGDVTGSADVQRDVDRALEALQFQDTTRQMIESALELLSGAKDGLEAAADQVLPRMSDNAFKRLFERSRAQLVAHAKTKPEKEALLEVRL